MEQTPDATEMLLASGYDRRKTPERKRFRRMTVAEAKALSRGQHVPFLANDGTVRTVKINGQPKTWKRSPERVEVSVKYGMYECARLSESGTGCVDRLLVALD